MLDNSFIVSKGIDHLQSRSFHSPEGWVEACVAFLSQEEINDIATMSIKTWLERIEQQWLFTDLCDLETATPFTKALIKDGAFIDKYEFTGVVCLQVMSFEDVSKSFYSQIEEVRGNTIDNFEEERENQKNSKRRSLQLHLSDGVNKICGFEFESWNNIKLNNLISGCKCRLKGPFLVIKGIALLKEDNISVLGGEVEDMDTSDTLSRLNELLQNNVMKINNNTKSNIPQNISRNSYSKQVSKAKIPTQNRSLLDESQLPATIDQPKTIILNREKSISISVVENIRSANNTYEKVILKTEQSKSHNYPIVSLPSSQSNTQKTCLDFEDDDDDFMDAFKDDNIDGTAEVNQQIKDNNLNHVTYTSKEPSKVDENVDSVVANYPILEEQSEIKEIFSDSDFKKESACAEEPVISLIDIFTELSKSDSSSITNKRYKVKALITSFLSKLTTIVEVVGVYRWSLELRISDGTSSLDCQFSDGFMTAKIGFNANTFHKLKQSNSVDQLKVVISDFQKKIVKCNCGIFTLQLSDLCEKIEVVDYTEIDESSVNLLKEAISRLV